MKRHPNQEIVDGRFVKNAIVEFLLDLGPFDLNDLARRDFTPEDRRQFAQLIGYSIDGYSSLSYVDDAELASCVQGEDKRDVLIKHYEDLLRDLRLRLAEPLSELYEKHPTDFTDGLI